MKVAVDLASWIEARRPRVERALDRILPSPAGPAATAIGWPDAPSSTRPISCRSPARRIESAFAPVSPAM